MRAKQFLDLMTHSEDLNQGEEQLIEDSIESGGTEFSKHHQMTPEREEQMQQKIQQQEDPSQFIEQMKKQLDEPEKSLEQELQR